MIYFSCEEKKRVIDMESILIVDDDRNLCKILKGHLEKADFKVLTAYDVDSAMPIIEERALDLVISDLKMPGNGGMELLSMSREIKPAVPVIIITAHGDIDTAVTAMKKGAFDFITKPFDEGELLNVVKKAISESQKNKELLSEYFKDESQFLPGFIGSTPAIQQIFQTVKKIAPTDPTVLITGETGVGKEVIARAIYLASSRREHPFVKVNCAAIPENLIESELFGYEKGAFTGAVTSKPGRFEIANRGTIFLDEVGEIPLHLQVKLLSVLQDKKFERLGGVKTIDIDFRIIAATNVDLQLAVKSGTFRSDLFYRLNVVPIHIPPLIARKEDISPQVEYFLEKFSLKYKKKVTRVSTDVTTAFTSYDWPGNTRELENVLERMVLMTDGETLEVEDLPPEILGTVTPSEPSTLKEKVDTISRVTEKQMIVDALEKANQNRTKAAKMLGISRRTLQNKIKEYGL